MLNELNLVNFQRHRELSVRFAKGFNVIVGPNWAGKSTVLRGCLYALFGVSAVPGGKNSIQNRSTTSHCVTLRFLDVYKVVRQNDKANLYLLSADNEELIASGNTPVNAKIESLIGMSRQDFCNVRYAKQKHAENLLMMGAAPLYKLMSEVTGENVVLKVISAATAEASALQLKAAEAKPARLPEEISADIAQAEKTVENSKTYLSELDPVLAVAISAHNKRLGEIAAAKAINADIAKAIRELDDAKVQLTKKQGQLSNYSKHLDATSVKILGASEKDRLKAVVAESVTALEQLLKDEKVYQAWVESQRTAASVLAAAEASLASAAANLVAVSRTYSEACELYDSEDTHKELLNLKPLAKLPEGGECEGLAHTDASAAADAVSEARLKMSLAVSRLNATKKSLTGAFCSECNRPLDASHAAELEARLPSEEKAVADATDTLSKTQIAAERYRAVLGGLKAMSEASAAGKSAHAAVAAAKATLERINSAPAAKDGNHSERWNSITARKTEAEKALNDSASAEDTCSQLHTMVSQLIQETADQQARVDKLAAVAGRQPVELADKEALANQQSDEISKMSSSKATAEATLSLLTRQLSKLRDDLAAATKATADHKAFKESAETHKALAKFISDNRDTFTADMWASILGYAGSVAAACSDGEISEIRRSPEGDFQYVENGMVMGAEEASGAQGSILGLSVQMALSQVLPSNVDFLMFDEPTDSMSPEVSMAFSMLLSKLGGQVIIISHREMDGLVADNLIHLTK